VHSEGQNLANSTNYALNELGYQAAESVEGNTPTLRFWAMLQEGKNRMLQRHHSTSVTAASAITKMSRFGRNISSKARIYANSIAKAVG
jgi:hypothetical protein